ncbi:TIGR03086 family metal-binding protein [Yinghuangia soli]|uniref:TIGR03086 family metal-binding protein n=1 Tax=Yinghuangia soli TaxID=2908204 RepID=A0AA41TZW7_9ACTN|nr:TIGR03086 family metal-binding protein [Yinghuangia soli]MCF2525797.1 TIGR03086 family metal-binding protein [Yinghuangia soli]
MGEIAERYQRRADAFEAKAAAVRPEQWAAQSPCAEWDARGVVAHIVEMHAVMLRAFDRSLPAEPSMADDPLGAFRAARAAVEAILHDPAEAEREVETPTGKMTAEQHIDGVASADMVLHGWDLAKATGQDATIDPAEVAATWAEFQKMPAETLDMLRTPEAFGPGVEVFGREVKVPDDAPLQDRLLGTVGRDPNWTAPA